MSHLDAAFTLGICRNKECPERLSCGRFPHLAAVRDPAILDDPNFGSIYDMQQHNCFQLRKELEGTPENNRAFSHKAKNHRRRKYKDGPWGGLFSR